MASTSNAGRVLNWGLGVLGALVTGVLISMALVRTGAPQRVSAAVAALPAAVPGPPTPRWAVFLIELGHVGLALLVLVVFVKLWIFLWLVANKESDLAPLLDGRPESDPLPGIVQAPGEGD